ncbi:MAG: hypothetical protein KAU31_04680 [Spirochaetaceae bacterium]|nr:hypothetical protein [Spirochaetaceae bacterium]
MIQQNELVTLILGMGALGFFVLGRVRIRELPRWRFFLLSFTALCVGWVLTVLEGFFWPAALNLAEHICYAVSSIVFALWCWRVFAGARETGE